MRASHFVIAWASCSLFTVVAQAARPGLYGISDLYLDTVHIDLNTMVATRLGPTGAPFSYSGVAYDSDNGKLYATSSFDTKALYVIDTQTGAATPVGTPGTAYKGGLDYDSRNHILYGVTDRASSGGDLYRVDTLTGQDTHIGHMPVGLQGLAYDSRRDRLVGVKPQSGMGLAQFYEVDRATGAQLLIASSGYLDSCGLAYDADRDLFWANDTSSRKLHSIDPVNFAYTSYVPSGVDLGQFIGLAYVPVPEPATVSLLALGGLALLRRKRGYGG